MDVSNEVPTSAGGPRVVAVAPPEPSSSTLPASSISATHEPAPARPLFDALHQAKDSLGSQASTSAQMHPFSTSLQSLYSALSPDGWLSRDQYRQLIAQIRHSVSHFAANSPALNSQPSTSNAAQASQAANTANQLRRYISLLTETSTHTAALAHSVSPLKSVDCQPQAAVEVHGTDASFSRRLQAGVLRTDSAHQPTTSWDDALETLGSLCDALEHTAKSLGLETFSEPSPEATNPPTDGNSTLTHTLTLGAKILVIDIEFIVTKASGHSGFLPNCKLKLSYASDSGDTQHVRDVRLGAVLARDVQLIADKLFGPAAPATLEQDRSRVTEALSNWTANLSKLLALDHLEAKASESAPSGSRTTDLFGAMQELSAAVMRVGEAEASASDTPTLLNRGHGLHRLHESTPFIRTTFARNPTCKQEYTLSLDIQALDLPASDQPATDVMTPCFPLSQAAHDLVASSGRSDSVTSLGSIPSPVDSHKQVPLHFVVRLSPPVVVTRPTAARLAAICNLKPISPNSNTAGVTGSVPTGPTWFEDVLAASWARRKQQDVDQGAVRQPKCTFTLAQTVESVRSTESQGLVIDSLPLVATSANAGDAMDESSDVKQPQPSTLSRLLALIEVLRDEIKVTELMHAAISSSKDADANDENSAAQLSLDDMLSGASAADSTPAKIPVTLAFRTPLRGAEDQAHQTLCLQLAFRVPAETGATVIFDASISPAKRSSAAAWSLSAAANLASAGRTETKTAQLDSASSEAQGIVAKLVDLESLEDVVLGLIDWADKQLEVRIKKPTATTATAAGTGTGSFDPLWYEQQNVHAIYETIAPHFSSTRYKPWPLIPAFLSTLPQGSLGADLGRGNGKYLPIRSTLALPATASEEHKEEARAVKSQNSLLTVGVDRSSNLIGLARDNFGMVDRTDATKRKQEAKDDEANAKRCQEVAVGDAIHSSLRTGVFDYAISIATIHHFSTWERRRAAVQELIRIVSPVNPPSSFSSSSSFDSQDSQMPTDARLEGGHGRGRFMIFVWALEQKDEGKRQFEASGPESVNEGREIHDPNHAKSWERLVAYSGLKAAAADKEAVEVGEVRVTDDQDVLVPWVLLTSASQKKPKQPKRPKQSKDKVGQTSAIAIQEGVAKLSITPNSPPKQAQAQAGSDTDKQANKDAPPVYNRYYHMFRAGELESLVEDAAANMSALHNAKIEVVREACGWERGNWWGVWRVQWAN